MEIFHRHELAAQLAGRILRPASGAAGSAGVFLAAPRRTGKSTFLREDLRPALERAGGLVLYADLWEDRSREPADVLGDAVQRALGSRRGALVRLARTAGIEKLGVAGVSIALERIGVGGTVSLAQALAELSRDANRPIVLIIDEAQHAATTKAGNDALFALKAARDLLNSSGHGGLRIVATGSNRDKLAVLRNGREQALYGMPLIDFPLLGADYVEWFCAQATHNGIAGLQPAVVVPVFEEAGHRPEVLAAALDAISWEVGTVTADVGLRFTAQARAEIDAQRRATREVLQALTPLQRAVLTILARDGSAYTPFAGATLQRYGHELERLDGSREAPAAASVQSALTALQERALIWQASRGVYALEDRSLGTILDDEIRPR